MILSWLMGSVGKWFVLAGAGTLAVLAAYGYGYVKGDARCATKFELAEAIADRNAAREELANLREITAAQAKLGEEHQKRTKANDEVIKELEDVIGGLPPSECDIPAGFLRRLEGLRESPD